MKKFLPTILILFLLCCSFYVKAQSYCLQFSKDGKKSLSIEKGKRVSYVLLNDSIWHKGKLTRISADSVFIEKSIKTFDDSSFIDILAYGLSDFRMIAYPKTSRIVGTSILVTAIIGAYVTTAVLTGTAPPLEFLNYENDTKEPSARIYEKEIDFEDDWKVEIINCPLKE